MEINGGSQVVDLTEVDEQLMSFENRVAKPPGGGGQIDLSLSDDDSWRAPVRTRRRNGLKRGAGLISIQGSGSGITCGGDPAAKSKPDSSNVDGAIAEAGSSSPSGLHSESILTSGRTLGGEVVAFRSGDGYIDPEMVECGVCNTQAEAHTFFCLDACGHKLCPTCVATHICNGSSVDPVCPMTGCSSSVSVRNLALLLQEDAWESLQARRLEAFRGTLKKGVRCSCCKGWIDVGSAKGGPNDVEVEVIERAPMTISAPVAKKKCRDLLVVPKVNCPACKAVVCRMCGHSYRHHACGATKLYSLDGLLSFLEELAGSHPNAHSTGQANSSPLKGQSGRGRRRGRGQGRGRGREHGHPSYRSNFNGISPKWSKGTGYGGGADKAVVAAGVQKANQAEAREDTAVEATLKAVGSCLPGPSEMPAEMPELIRMLRESVLLQSLCSYLRNDSLMDIAKRKGLYVILLDLVQCFSKHELLAPLIDSLPRKNRRDKGGKGGSRKQTERKGARESVETSGSRDTTKGKGKGKLEVPPTASGEVEVLGE
ncbi:unnamed protein product, partial [Discosporangium mesarthrocarpum]